MSASAGECLAWIGRNGAGKSSLLNAIVGVATMTGGSVLIDGQDISRLKPHQRVSHGLSLTMEQRRTFAMRVAIRSYVLNLGIVLLEGNSAELAPNPEVAPDCLGHSAAPSPSATASGESVSPSAT